MFSPEDGGSIFLRNVKHLPTVLHFAEIKMILIIIIIIIITALKTSS
jgi:hypothetical protein